MFENRGRRGTFEAKGEEGTGKCVVKNTAFVKYSFIHQWLYSPL
jgi:hypothetical protein